MANVLVVAPHPDDAELGMGATIARLAAQGHDVLILDATNGEPTPHGDPETRAREADEAARLLSPDPTRFQSGRPVRRVCLGLPNRFVTHTIEARHAVAGVIRAHQAQVMFVPFPEDAHPDHRAVTRIAEDARFDAKLTGIVMPAPSGLPPPTSVLKTQDSGLKTLPPPIYPRWLFHYYCTHLRIVPEPSFILDATGFEEAKQASILAYRSQFVVNERNRAVPEWLMHAARFYGSRIGTQAGEPFFAREPLGLTSLDSLPL
ncbi:MAG TPA: PIG-L family deacetylase [Phycisphaerales bacterium]|nr:PIG-L family deacetylase [Phycisphaerales bacterium]